MRSFFYVASIEDPFDATDNCGRSIQNASIERILRAFRAATAALNGATDASGLPWHLQLASELLIHSSYSSLTAEHQMLRNTAALHL